MSTTSLLVDTVSVASVGAGVGAGAGVASPPPNICLYFLEGIEILRRDTSSASRLAKLSTYYCVKHKKRDLLSL
jgi:hypothetical protein